LLSPAVAVYTVATTTTLRRTLLATAGVTVVLSLATAVFQPFGVLAGPVTVLPFEMAIALAAGVAGANRRAFIAAIRGVSSSGAGSCAKHAGAGSGLGCGRVA